MQNQGSFTLKAFLSWSKFLFVFFFQNQVRLLFCAVKKCEKYSRFFCHWSHSTLFCVNSCKKTSQAWSIIITCCSFSQTKIKVQRQPDRKTSQPLLSKIARKGTYIAPLFEFQMRGVFIHTFIRVYILWSHTSLKKSRFHIQFFNCGSGSETYFLITTFRRDFIKPMYMQALGHNFICELDATTGSKRLKRSLSLWHRYLSCLAKDESL